MLPKEPLREIHGIVKSKLYISTVLLNKTFVFNEWAEILSLKMMRKSMIQYAEFSFSRLYQIESYHIIWIRWQIGIFVGTYFVTPRCLRFESLNKRPSKYGSPSWSTTNADFYREKMSETNFYQNSTNANMQATIDDALRIHAERFGRENQRGA